MTPELEVLLDEQLDTDNGHVLREQLSKAEAWQRRVSSAYRAAEQALSTAKGKCFNPTLSSEDKRKIDLEYKVRDEQKAVDQLSDAANILSRRVSFGQTMLRSIQGEMESGLR